MMKFQVALDKVSEVSPLLTPESQQELKSKSDAFLSDVEDSQYIKVPLVGVFSAGKSSLLNVFTQKPNMLPVDTMPETAVACEIYYSASECVELYRDGKKIDTKKLEDFKQLDTKPGDIAKVFCDSAPIKDLQNKGIILVDMPGIGSGIERHDAAIFNYIKSGTAFVLIVDADQGSLRGSTLSFMQELSRYDMYPAVLVSKIDKKPEADVKGIVEYIQYQMTKLGNQKPFISTVCSVNNDLAGFNKYMNELDPESLVAQKLKAKLNSIINSVIDQLKIRVEIRTKDITNIDEKQKEIDEEISKIKAELPTSRDADSPEKSAQDILHNVRTALEAKATEIAQMIINKENNEAIKSVIVSTIRTEIFSSLKEESEQYSSALSASVQNAIQNIATIDMDDDVIEGFDNIFKYAYGFIDDLLDFGGIWGVLANLLLPFLPNVINWLFGKSDEQILSEVREKVMTKCVNKITDSLQPTILKMTTDNQKKIQEKIQAELVSKMEKVKEGLREKKDDANKSKEEVAKDIENLNNAIAKMKEISNTI